MWKGKEAIFFFPKQWKVNEWKSWLNLQYIFFFLKELFLSSCRPSEVRWQLMVASCHRRSGQKGRLQHLDTSSPLGRAAPTLFFNVLFFCQETARKLLKPAKKSTAGSPKTRSVRQLQVASSGREPQRLICCRAWRSPLPGAAVSGHGPQGSPRLRRQTQEGGEDEGAPRTSTSPHFFSLRRLKFL